MHIPRTFAILAAGFLILGNSIQARPRTCRLVYPERPQSAPKIAFLFDGSTSKRVTLPSMNFSEVIELPSGEINIAMTLNEVIDPETLSPQAPRLRIPEDAKDFYIILTHDPQNQELPIKMNLVNTGDGKLKPGETLWFNLTGHRIVAKLGNKDMSVNPNSKTVSRDPVPASGYYAARFAYQANGTGALAPITEQSWWHDTRSRHLGFITYTGGKLPKIYFFRDYRELVQSGKMAASPQEAVAP